MYFREVFKNESAEISQYLQGSHYSRKLAHKQINYPDTIVKLSKLQEKIPVYITQPLQKDAGVFEPIKLKEFQESLNAQIKVANILYASYSILCSTMYRRKDKLIFVKGYIIVRQDVQQ